MNLTNLQAAIGGLVASAITISVGLGVMDSGVGQAVIAAVGPILAGVFQLVVAIENHGKKTA